LEPLLILTLKEIVIYIFIFAEIIIMSAITGDVLFSKALKGDLDAARQLARMPEDPRITAELNKQDPKGQTALIKAAKKGHIDIVKALMTIPGINPHINDDEGQTALTLALENDHTEIVEFFKTLDIVPLDQKTILLNFTKYLKIQLEQYGKSIYHDEDMEVLIHELIEGTCNGLTGLWLIQKLKKLPVFFDDLTLIEKWDGKKESLTKPLVGIFEQVLSNMRWLDTQSSLLKHHIESRHLGQEDLHEAYEIVKPQPSSVSEKKLLGDMTETKLSADKSEAPSLANEFRIAFIFKAPELTKLLQNVLHNSKKIAIGGADHMMGIMLIEDAGGKKYYARDPISPTKEVVFTDLKKLQRYIERQLFSNLDAPTDLMPISLNVYDEASGRPYPYEMTPEQMIELFLKEDQDRTAEDNMGNLNSLLPFACMSGDINTVRLLLSKKTTEELKVDKDTWIALKEAAFRKRMDIVEIIAKAAGINLTDPNILFMIAIAIGDVAAVQKAIAEGVDVNMKDLGPLEQTPLNLGSYCGHAKIVEALMKAPNINLTNLIDCQFCLQKAATRGHIGVVRHLIGIKDLDLNYQDFFGETALTLATEKQYTYIIKALVETGKIDPNLQNKEGFTALMIAVDNDDEDAVNILLEARGIDKKNFWKSLMFAIENKNQHLVEIVAKTAGINLNDPNIKLMVSAATGDLETLRKLAAEDHGPDFFNQKDIGGLTALIHAVNNGHSEVVQFLISQKVDLNVKDEEDWTALMIAVDKGDESMVEILSTAPGVKLDLTNNKGDTALVVAKKNHHDDIATRLGILTGTELKRSSDHLSRPVAEPSAASGTSAASTGPAASVRPAAILPLLAASEDPQLLQSIARTPSVDPTPSVDTLSPPPPATTSGAPKREGPKKA